MPTTSDFIGRSPLKELFEFWNKSIMLNDREAIALAHGPDFDVSMAQARQLRKAHSPSVRRRRTTPNVFTTLEGAPQPRQGFLSLEILRAIYLRSELVRACCDTLIEMVCALPWTIKPVDEDRALWLKQKDEDRYKSQQRRIAWAKQFFQRPNGYESLEMFHRRLLLDLLIYDAGAYEIVAADMGDRSLPLELGAIAGDTVELECDEAGIVQRYHQSYNVLHNVAFEPTEMAYLMLHPCSWQPYGISPIETAYISIASDLNANKYNSSFFAKDGIPPGILAVLGVSDVQFRNLQTQLRQTSSDNPWNIHMLRAQRTADGREQKVFDFTPLSNFTNRDMQFAELMSICVNRVTMLYGVTPSQIGFTADMTGGIGNGIAETQADLTQNKGVAPIIRHLGQSHTFNVLHTICGWHDLEFAFVQSNTPQQRQEHEDDMQHLQIGAATINEFRAKQGKKPVKWGDDPLQAPQTWLQKQQQQQQQQAIAPQSPQSPQAPPQLQKSLTITF